MHLAFTGIHTGTLEMNKPIDRIAVSIDQAVEISGIGRTALYAAIKSGQLLARKFGRRTLIAVDDLKAFLNRLPTVSGDSADRPAR